MQLRSCINLAVSHKGLKVIVMHITLHINEVLTDCKFAMDYLDYIIIFNKTEGENLQHLEEILQQLQKAGLKIKLQKCSFFKQHIQYLGHLISDEGIQPLPEKLESIAKLHTPKNAKQVKQFLGFVGYYRKFVPHFVDISRLLTHLTKNNESFMSPTLLFIVFFKLYALQLATGAFRPLISRGDSRCSWVSSFALGPMERG